MFKVLLAINIFSVLFSYLRNMYIFIPAVLVMTLFTGILRDTGPDFNSYVEFFKNMAVGTANHLQQSDIEASWEIFGIVLSKFFDVPTIMGLVFLLSVSIRMWALKIYFDKKAYRFLGFLIYASADLFSRDIGQIRNGLAASLFCLVFALYQTQGRPRWFFLIPSIAHLSYFSVYFSYILTRKISPLLLILLGITAIVLMPVLFEVLIGYISPNADQGVVFKLVAYTTGYKNTNGIALTFPLVLFSLGASMFLMRRDSKFNIYFLFFLASTVFYVSLKDFPVFASRLFSIYTPILMFFIPELIKVANLSTKARSMIYIFLVATFILIVIYRYIRFFNNYGG